MVSLVIIPGTEGNENYLLKMRAIGARKPRGAAFELVMGLPRVSIQKGYCCTFTVYRDFLVYVGSSENSSFRVILRSTITVSN